MKIKKVLNSIVYALVIGFVVSTIGIGLVFWYMSRDNATVVSYFFSGLVIAGGLVGLVGGSVNSIKLLIQQNVLKKGTKTTAKYIKHDCNIYNKNGSLYYIEYEYEDGGNVVHKKSGNEYVWKEILALKCAGTFEIAHYKGRCVLMTSLAELQIQYATQMNELQEIYSNAYDGVDEMIKRDKNISHKRRRDIIDEKTKKDGKNTTEKDGKNTTK
ncbi:MAG: hypothetical protein RR348_05700 [Clostridia bacterium]